MNQYKKQIIEVKINNTIAALAKNNMNGIYAPDCQAAVEEVKKLLPDGCTVSMGGCATAAETGILDLLRSGRYNFLDRNVPGLTGEQIMDIYRKTFCADAFITSANAVTENGELYNVDGNSNRVSAMLFGPDKVIVIAGYNKIVSDIDDAIKRVKTTAAPINAARLGCDTPCTKTGKCVSLSKQNPHLCDGCASDARICANYTVMARQRRNDRVYVILVGEELGF